MTDGWATLRAHQCAVRSLGFAPSGRQLVSGDDYGQVVLWSLEIRRPLLVWEAHGNALLATRFWGTTSELVVTHGRDNLLRIWNPAEVADGVPRVVHEQDVNALNFCPVALAPATSEQLVFATPASTASERIDVYVLTDFKLSRPFRALDAAEALPLDTQLEDEGASQRRGLLGTVMALQFSDNSLVAGYESGHVASFDLQTGEVRCLVQVHKSPVLSLELAIENHHLVAYVSAANRQLSRLNISTQETMVVTRLAHKGVASVSICDSLMVTAGWDGNVRLFERREDWEEVAAFPGMKQAGITVTLISAVEPSPRRRLKPLPDKWIAVAGKNGRIGLFAVGSLTEITKTISR